MLVALEQHWTIRLTGSESKILEKIYIVSITARNNVITVGIQRIISTVDKRHIFVHRVQGADFLFKCNRGLIQLQSTYKAAGVD